jgi:alpha-1,2-mannosyltransferase
MKKKPHFLNEKRLRYALIAGGILWIGWLFSLILGSGDKDLAGQVIGTDYVQFYAAGTTLRKGESTYLYDFEYQHQLEEEIIGAPIEGLHGFITPPFMAWVFVPLSVLPYIWSFIIWCVIGLVLLWLSLRWLESRHPFKHFTWALSWFPIFAAISFGQNSILSLAILCLTYMLWHRDRPWAAGLICSLVLYKPQLALGVGFLWLLEWRRNWKALAGLALGGCLLGGLSLAFMQEASIDYIKFTRTFLPSLLSQKGFPIWHAHTPRAFWQLLFPGFPGLVDGLFGLCLVVGIVGYFFFWHRLHDKPVNDIISEKKSTSTLLYSGAIVLTLWVSPHAMIYDWAILLIPAILVWQNTSVDLKGIFALVWVATFLSGSLTIGQLKLLPFAIQISIPILAISVVWIYRLLTRTESILPTDGSL